MFLIARDRALISLSGEDRQAFLQGLVSNDVAKVTAAQAIYAAFLTAQGKYLHDIFIAGDGERLLIECEAARRADLLRRLSLYKLRSKVALAEENNLSVGLWFGDGSTGRVAPRGQSRRGAGRARRGDLCRSAAGGIGRARLSAAPTSLPAETGSREDYDRLRISLGVPDGSRDLPVEKAILLENGFDELNAIDWDKGCYMGQELTARTRYRGLVRKRLMPVAIEGPAPEFGAAAAAGRQGSRRDAQRQRRYRPGAGAAGGAGPGGADQRRLAADPGQARLGEILIHRQ